jgi:cytochrome c6|tara:strand:- start:180 stop:518 length:339 start_codon:yes stop_codon:yes gene_type:complete
MITKRISQIILVLFLTFTRGKKIFAFSFEEGRDIFNKNCIACHQGGNNMVIPEKNLKKLTLKANGIFDKDAIIYQVLNGKNGMPAFGERLKTEEIENVAEYVLSESEKNFEF